MLKIFPKENNRVDVELQGKLDKEKMQSALTELRAKTENISHGKMLYRIEDFQFPTLGAIGVELKNMPELLNVAKKFDRVAVLTEKNWIKKVSEFEGKLFPGMQIKAFDLNDTVSAENWLDSIQDQ